MLPLFRGYPQITAASQKVDVTLVYLLLK